MDSEKAADILPEIIDDLLSYDETRYKHVLESYFTKDAQLTHPLLNVGGTHNIRKVFRVWTSLNSQQPDIKDYPIFDGYVAIIHLIQHLRPRFFPFFHFEIPSVTVLRLREDEDTGLLYIYKQEDNWTLEGLIQSVPIVNWWYEKVVRYIMGELITGAGDFLYTANTATSRLTDRAGEFRDTSNIAIEQGQIRARSMVNGLSDSVKSQLLIAQEGVLNQYNKVRGIQKNDYMIKSKDDDEYEEDDEEGDEEDYEEEEEDDNDDNDDDDDDDLQ